MKIQINNFKENVYHEKLENGLEIYLVPLKKKKNFSCMYVTRYGGRDISFKVENKEYNTPTGIAHFLEHKLFERKEDPFKFYQKYGIDVNASTSLDYTNYYFLGNSGFEKGLKFLLEWLKKVEITDESVKKEQGIILEEASMHEDNPERVLYSKIKENVFKNDPSKYKVIGTNEDIRKITKEDLETCFDTFYSPDNMYLIAAGNINPEKTMEIIKNSTKDLKSTKNIVRNYPLEDDKVNKSYEEIYMNIKVPLIGVAYKMPKSNFKDLNLSPYELDVYLHSLMNIGLGQTSKIREQWLEQELFSTSFYSISEIDTHYVIEICAKTKKNEELIKEFGEYAKDFQIDKESFEREKRLWIAHEIRLIDSPMDVCYSILDNLLDYKKIIPNKIDIIKNLKYEKLVEVKKCIDLKNKSIVKILPDNQEKSV